MIVTTLVLLCYVSYLVYDWWKRRPFVDGIHKKAVFITGCDTGFGNALAKSLYRRGVHVYAGCLTESAARKLEEETGERLKTVIVDVSNTESIRRAANFVKETLTNDTVFWAVVNNAGIAGSSGPVELQTRDHFREAMDVNLYGLLDVTNAFLPLLKQSKGRVVNMCSIISEYPFPNHSPYTVSKYAAKGFSQTLRLEKSVWGISVSAIEPAFFKTSLINMESYRQKFTEKWNSASPEFRDQYGEQYVEEHLKLTEEFIFFGISNDISPVIEAYEHALFSVCPRAVYYPGLQAKMAMVLPTSVVEYIIRTKIALPKYTKP